MLSNADSRWKLETQNCSRVIFVTPPLCQTKFLRFDPTLSSNNSGPKNYSNKNHHIFGIGRTSNFCNREKSVCVCIVLVHRGPFPQEINGKSVKLAVWAVSKVIFSVETSLVFGIIKVPASFLHEDCISLCLVFVSVLSLLVHDSGTRVFGLITFPALLYYGDVRVREAVVNEIVPKHSETYFQKAFALS